MLIAGMIFVCLASFAAGFLWARLAATWLSLACALVFPICVSWVVYWAPLQGVTDTSEYSTWYGVFATLWLVPALPVSVASTLLVRRTMGKKNAHAD
jgi:hypothetical protein